jgi:uncharacterized protein with PQ loop repeat
MHFHKLVKLEVTASISCYFFPLAITCILLTVWIIRNYLLIVVALDQLVNIQKLIKAARNIYTTLQLLPLLISQHYTAHVALLFV